jgi:hypothetical protein
VNKYQEAAIISTTLFPDLMNLLFDQRIFSLTLYELSGYGTAFHFIYKSQ